MMQVRVTVSHNIQIFLPINLVMRLVITLYLILSPTLLFADEPVPLELTDRDSHDLSPSFQYFEDKFGNIPFERVVGMSDKFIQNESNSLQFGYGKSAYWIRFSVINRSELLEWYLVYAYPWIGNIDIFRQMPDGSISEQRLGANLPFNKRPVKNRNFVLPLELEQDEASTFYMRIQSQTSRPVPVTFVKPSHFHRIDREEQLVFGLYYGIMLIMIVYNLFLWVFLRDKNYILYVLFIVVWAMLQFILNGLAFEYIWPGLPWLNNKSLGYIILFSEFAGILFGKEFLRTNQFQPLLNKILIGCLAATAACMFISLFVDLLVTLQMVSILSVFGIPSVFIASFVILKKGYKPARYYLIAWASVFIGVGIMVLKNYNILPHNPFTNYSLQVGSVGLVVLLSIALADRINMIRMEKDNAQQQAIKNLNMADRLKDEFLANTSHELRTPLNGIIGIAGSLIDGVAGKLPEPVIENLGMIEASGKRLYNLVNDLLDFSLIKSKEIVLNEKSISLYHVVEQVLRVTSSMIGVKDIKLQNMVNKDLPPVSADENRLQQVLYNLIGNAVKFTNQGTVTVQAWIEDKRMHVSVTDTGIGIENEKLDLIFKSFEQADGSISREYGGSGLGLSITRHLVEQHGGSIHVSSTPGSGSCFTFDLAISSKGLIENSDDGVVHEVTMLTKSPESAPPVSNDRLSLAHGEYTVLVVDDEPVNCRVLENHLSNSGYRVTVAQNGPDALELINDNDLLFDIVLLDVMMPRMSGYEVCRRIRERFDLTRLPILMITARNMIDDIIKGMLAGANDYVTKPFVSEVLLARVQTLIQLKQSTMDLHSLNSELEMKIREQTFDLRTINRKLIEANAELSEKTEFKSRFLATISHEIRTPLNSIIGNNQLLLFDNYDILDSLRDCNRELLELVSRSEVFASLPVTAELTAFCERFEKLVFSQDYNLDDYYLVRLKNLLHGLDDTSLDKQETKRVNEILRTVTEIVDNRHESIINNLTVSQKSGEYLLHLINSLLDISKIEAGKIVLTIEQVNIAEFVEDIFVNAVAFSKAKNKSGKVTISKDIADNVPETNGFDRNRMKQVLLNLVTNAVKFTEKGYVQLNTVVDNENLVFVIRDSGVGIKKDEMDMLFKEFERTSSTVKMDGTGLGLVLSRKLVELHGGKVTADSEYKKGSIFKVAIPLLV
jgi:signal transduction histidine kinase